MENRPQGTERVADDQVASDPDDRLSLSSQRLRDLLPLGAPPPFLQHAVLLEPQITGYTFATGRAVPAEPCLASLYRKVHARYQEKKGLLDQIDIPFRATHVGITLSANVEACILFALADRIQAVYSAGNYVYPRNPAPAKEILVSEALYKAWVQPAQAERTRVLNDT
ncbi:hypothetical protein SISSUDRAFT_1038736, partial [Sistotremastrum suecicum HHB10207 ss-3]